MKIIAKGIDVSVNQGNVNWKKVKDSGVEFAMLKCAWGPNIADNFEKNYKEAKAVGMPVGAYCYSYAATVTRAKEEANAVVKILKGKTFEYPIAFDIEDVSQLNIPKKTLTEMCKAFCDILEKAGYYVSIYSYKSFLTDKLDMNALKDYDVWLSQFNKTVTYKGAYGMWQYKETAEGAVEGIKEKALLDYAYKAYPTIIKKAGLNGFKKPSSSSTTSKPASDTTKKSYKKGDKITLKNAPLYASASDTKAKTKKSGTFYIYDGVLTNGRYRVTISKALCGRKPMSIFVTGWIKKTDIK